MALNVSETDGDIHDESDGNVSTDRCVVGTDPGFVNGPVVEGGKLVLPTEPDLSLIETSPAHDTGTNAAVTTPTDLSGNPRIAGGTVDIGAYEYPDVPEEDDD